MIVPCSSYNDEGSTPQRCGVSNDPRRRACLDNRVKWNSQIFDNTIDGLAGPQDTLTFISTISFLHRVNDNEAGAALLCQQDGPIEGTITSCGQVRCYDDRCGHS
jgi:hypothetical protein